ncbi:hypothetical protein TSOC_002079 [Tetrabaena socialis]|uniref:Uncharacterized protein n=1 Tax=Tetrabaena socialis TaxID=47790 RepID=A0A2J8AEZ9_9CHLO|nr:hypothetical protein TSOC_002079 [Tetrabaena socialis]|eukprot:PNH11101.1 hypothetical protein TSOC_002079 [Tetrabaena socialis]
MPSLLQPHELPLVRTSGTAEAAAAATAATSGAVGGRTLQDVAAVGLLATAGATTNPHLATDAASAPQQPDIQGASEAAMERLCHRMEAVVESL